MAYLTHRIWIGILNRKLADKAKLQRILELVDDRFDLPLGRAACAHQLEFLIEQITDP